MRGGSRVFLLDEIKMDDFSTYQGALDIFSKVNCTSENDNWIFGAIIDKAKSTSFTASMIGNAALGTAGFIIGDALGQERDLKISKINDYFYVLFNFTENGVGIMPLIGGGLRINPEKQKPCYDGFVFYNYQELADISVKNYYGIRKSVKTITITLANKKKLHFTANMVEKPLPYQEQSMKKFVGKYQK